MNHNIHLLTLTWNGKEHLQKLYPTLKQMIKSTVGSNIYWHIKDNASTDGTEELIKSWNDDAFVKYHKYQNNLQNFSQGNNFLIDTIRNSDKTQYDINPDNDFYLLLNNDITVENPTSLQYMLDIMARDKDVGIVGSKLYYPGGKKLIQHFGVAMSPQHGDMPWHIFSRDFDSQFTKQDKLFQAVTGAFLLIRMSCFDALKDGKMNEKYNWAFEDIDMCLQVNKDQKKKIVCCARTYICHHESASLETNPVNKMFVGNNVKTFKQIWSKKYKLDYFDYLYNQTYNNYDTPKISIFVDNSKKNDIAKNKSKKK